MRKVLLVLSIAAVGGIGVYAGVAGAVTDSGALTASATVDTELTISDLQLACGTLSTTNDCSSAYGTMTVQGNVAWHLVTTASQELTWTSPAPAFTLPVTLSTVAGGVYVDAGSITGYSASTPAGTYVSQPLTVEIADGAGT